MFLLSSLTVVLPPMFLAESGLEWISTNRDQFTFCFPPELCPMSPFSSDRWYKLLLAVVQCKKYGGVAKGTLSLECGRLHPLGFGRARIQSIKQLPLPQP